MRHIVIFEDSGKSLSGSNKRNVESRLGNLLSSSSYGVEAFFSCGSRNIGEEIIAVVSDCVRGGDKAEILVYLDVLPGNNASIKLYYSLENLVKGISGVNVDIIPVVCTEYVVLSYLESYGMLRVKPVYENLKTVLLGRDYTTYFSELGTLYKGSFPKGLEKAYKYLLESVTDVCMRNSSLSVGKKGLFYSKGCDECSESYCRNCGRKDLSLKVKAECILAFFPCFLSVNESHERYLESIGLDFKRADVDKVKEEFMEFIMSERR